ncbi:hypothetical protein IAU60_000649 [Kwoniella sp. DSM 27419]
MSANNTNAYASGTANDGSAGAAGAQTLGEKVKGGWNVFHGAGEGIRGNVNSFVDNIGEQIAGRDSTAKPSSASGERPSAVAANGADEIQSGMNSLKK